MFSKSDKSRARPIKWEASLLRFFLIATWQWSLPIVLLLRLPEPLWPPMRSLVSVLLEALALPDFTVMSFVVSIPLEITFSSETVENQLWCLVSKHCHSVCTWLMTTISTKSKHVTARNFRMSSDARAYLVGTLPLCLFLSEAYNCYCLKI